MHIGLAIWPADTREWFEFGLSARPTIRCSILDNERTLPADTIDGLLIDGDNPGPSFVPIYRALVKRDKLRPMLVMGMPQCPALMAVEWDPNLTLFVPKPVQIESALDNLVRYVSQRLTDTQKIKVADRPNTNGKSMGYLSTLHVSDMLQMLCQGAWTGRLGVTHLTGEEQGEFFIDHGAIIHARQDRTTGLEACYLILAWKRSEYVFEEELSMPPPTIQEQWQEILLEGARRIDTGPRNPAIDSLSIPDKLFG